MKREKKKETIMKNKEKREKKEHNNAK